MINQELISWIQQTRVSGISDAQITQTLLAQGWSQSDITDTFAALTPARTTTPAQDTATASSQAGVQPFQKRNLIQDAGNFNMNITDIDQGVHSYIWSRHRTLYLTSIIGSTVLCVGLLFYLNQITSFASNPRAFEIPFFAFLWPVFLYAHYKLQIQHLFMEQIAQAIGFTHEVRGDATSITGRLLNIGHSKKMEDVISGTYQGYPIRIYDYTYTIGYGKGSHVEHHTIFEVAFDKKLPDIFLQPARYVLFSGNTGSDDISVTLEGDFNKYFILYAPKNYDMEIRVIFQPDLMADLIDKYQAYSIEIYENKLSVIAPLLTKKTDFLTTHDLVDSLFTKIFHSLKEVDDMGQDSSTARTQQSSAMPSVFSEDQL